MTSTRSPSCTAWGMEWVTIKVVSPPAVIALESKLASEDRLALLSALLFTAMDDKDRAFQQLERAPIRFESLDCCSCGRPPGRIRCGPTGGTRHWWRNWGSPDRFFRGPHARSVSSVSAMQTLSGMGVVVCACTLAACAAPAPAPAGPAPAQTAADPYHPVPRDTMDVETYQG
jgi:hypothetical protein